MYEILTTIVIFLVLAVLWGIKVAKKTEKRNKEIGAIDDCQIGKYIAGLSSADDPTTDIDCAITKNHFMFFSKTNKELGKIPRNSINQIIVDNKTKITQRLTVTRMLALGIFSLAAPKKKTFVEFCLVIDWQDDRGIRQNTIFEFTGDEANKYANKAANCLQKYITVTQTSEDVKACPYCSEMIKKAAKFCRFCNRNLETA